MMGTLKPQAKPMRPSDMAVLAQAVANSARPSFAGDHFAALRDQGLAQFGNYGMAHDPKQLSQKLQMNSLVTSLTPSIHDAIAGQMNSITSPTGPGGAVPIGNVGEPTTGAANGLGQPSRTGPYVDDKGWSVTLAGLLGQKAFSAEQLQTASIQNVNKLINWIGGGGSSETTHQQVAFMMQRYILEGYLHGVDIPRQIQAQYRNGMPIGMFADQGNTIGWGGGGKVTWSMSYWNNTDDAGRLADFYHEMGHELMGAQHESSTIMHYLVASSSQIKNDEANLLTQYFANHGPRGELGNGTPVVTIGAARPGAGVDPTSYMSGFPSLNGQPFDPNAPGPTGSTPTTPTGNTNNSTTNNVTQVQPSIAPSGLGSGGGRGPEPSKPSDQKTLVAGSMSGGVNGFAAGIQELSGGGGADLGTALAKLKSG